MTRIHSLLRAATAVSLMTGITLVFVQSNVSMQASLTSPGSTVLDRPEMTEETLRAMPVLHSAATGSDAGIQLLLGVLCILLGFLLHALLRHREERNVHITVVKNRKAPKPRAEAKWFWIHLHV